MNVPTWTQEQFFAWAEAQEEPYEFDGFQPVAMTGGNAGHSRITGNVHFALRVRRRSGPCEPLAPDAGVETLNNAVRYPDALVTRTRFENQDRVIPGSVVVFEVISPTSGRIDRIVKVREYAAVPSIRRYVIVESDHVGLTVFERTTSEEPWRASTLSKDDILHMPEIGTEVPVAELYENISFPEDSDAAG